MLDRLQTAGASGRDRDTDLRLAGFLLAEAWRQLSSGEPTARPASRYHAIYGRTQIAKYLPGNLFHFAGRQWLGRGLGHTQTTLALASVAETVLLVAVASALALPLASERLGGLPAAALLLGVALIVAPLLRRRLPRRSDWAAPRSSAPYSPGCGRHSFAAGSGSRRGAGHAGGPWIDVSALALAWIAGFVSRVPRRASVFGKRS